MNFEFDENMFLCRYNVIILMNDYKFSKIIDDYEMDFKKYSYT
jgi:hypothetical protein